MLIKTRLYLNVALSALAAFLIVAIVAFALSRIARAREKSRIAAALVVEAFERTAFRADYLQTGSARSQAQWYAKSEKIDGVLHAAAGTFRNAGEKKIIADLIENNKAAVRIFSDIVESRRKASSGGDATIRKDSQTEDVRRLDMKLNEYVANARTLNDAVDRRLSSAVITAGWIIICLLVALTGTVTLSSLSAARTINNRIARLGSGAAAVGKGDLGYTVELEGGDEFSRLAGAFNEMTQRLRESQRTLEGEIAGHRRTDEERERLIRDLEHSNKELEQFAYVASHDLQEPLRMVGSYVQLLERKYKGCLDEQADKYIAYAVEGAVRMQKLIEGLLAYSRIGTRGADFRPVDMNEVFDNAVSNLSVVLRESGGSARRDALPTVQGDELQLLQLLQNLIGNAIKFRKPDMPPAVHVAAGREGEEWVFSVSDNGIGIKPEHFERIFRIFQRLHTRREYPGTGIGLALCKLIVERHHGRIWVESSPGEGASFHFSIPVQ
ncbi:MAG: ATP-binding protein [Thermodesulfovibrionales bacterium]